ncbi:MAG: hypothetical protein V3S43_06475 [Acidimicrobiia bacterium]
MKPAEIDIGMRVAMVNGDFKKPLNGTVVDLLQGAVTVSWDNGETTDVRINKLREV